MKKKHNLKLKLALSAGILAGTVATTGVAQHVHAQEAVALDQVKALHSEYTAAQESNKQSAEELSELKSQLVNLIKDAGGEELLEQLDVKALSETELENVFEAFTKYLEEQEKPVVVADTKEKVEETVVTENEVSSEKAEEVVAEKVTTEDTKEESKDKVVEEKVEEKTEETQPEVVAEETSEEDQDKVVEVAKEEASVVASEANDKKQEGAVAVEEVVKASEDKTEEVKEETADKKESTVVSKDADVKVSTPVVKKESVKETPVATPKVETQTSSVAKKEVTASDKVKAQKVVEKRVKAKVEKKLAKGQVLSQDEFINLIGKEVQRYAQEYNVYGSVMMAQAALQSGWGTSAVSQSPNNNVMGITAGASEQGIEFRVYENIVASLKDYGELIRNGVSWDKNFYRGAWRENAKTYQEATKWLTGRYAIDPNYHHKLNQLIKQYNLTRFDVQTSSVVKPSTSTSVVKETVKLPVQNNTVIEKKSNKTSEQVVNKSEVNVKAVEKEAKKVEAPKASNVKVAAETVKTVAPVKPAPVTQPKVETVKTVNTDKPKETTERVRVAREVKPKVS